MNNGNGLVIFFLVTVVVAGCVDNKQPPLTAKQGSSPEAERTLDDVETEVLPDADVKRVPVNIKIAEAKSLNQTVYRPNKIELDSIGSRVRRLLEKEIDVTGTQVLYSKSISLLNRIPYARTTMNAPPASAKRAYRLCYQEGMVRCVFKIENGSEQLNYRVFYDEAGAPAIICEHNFGSPFPTAVHYLQYDDGGHLSRVLEFWASEKDGLRHRASYVVQADSGYENTVMYWFSDTGEFREKYIHTTDAVYEQTHRDDQPKPVSRTNFQTCISHPRQYGMKSLLPIPNK